MLRNLRRASAALALCFLAACAENGGDSPLTPSPVNPLSIEHLASSVSSGDITGLRRSGAHPVPGAGPRINATGNQTVLTGGTLTVSITGDAPFTTVYMLVAGRSLGLVGEADGGISGYYEVQLPVPQTSTSLLLTFPQEVPLSEFDLQFAVASPSGVVGPFTSLHTRVIGVGTGDVQVTLAWDADSDVDLHVVGPDGEEIFYGNRESRSGGELDLDSNAACEIDGVRNENITWPVGRAPRGVYTVRVNYWASCGVTQTNYTVRINNGGSVQIFTGTLTGSGTGGGQGAGRVIATFERTSGPTAVISAQTSNMTPPQTTTAKGAKVKR